MDWQISLVLGFKNFNFSHDDFQVFLERYLTVDLLLSTNFSIPQEYHPVSKCCCPGVMRLRPRLFDPIDPAINAIIP